MTHADDTASETQAERAKAERHAQKLRGMLAKLAESRVAPMKLLGGQHFETQAGMAGDMVVSVEEGARNYGMVLKIALASELDESSPPKSESYYLAFKEFVGSLGKSEDGTCRHVNILGRVRNVVEGKERRWPVVEMSLSNADADSLGERLDQLAAAAEKLITKRTAYRSFSGNDTQR